MGPVVRSGKAPLFVFNAPTLKEAREDDVSVLVPEAEAVVHVDRDLAAGPTLVGGRRHPLLDPPGRRQAAADQGGGPGGLSSILSLRYHHHHHHHRYHGHHHYLLGLAVHGDHVARHAVVPAVPGVAKIIAAGEKVDFLRKTK